jgi:hypothetical protein
MPPHEPLENSSSKERENNLMPEKEVHKEADSVYFTKNAAG